MPKRSPNSSALYAFFCVALLISCALLTAAQSGRRGSKSTSVPVATPEPTPTLTKPAEKQKAAVTFIIGMDTLADYSRIPLYVSGAVLRTCASRLDEPASVEVETVNNNMSRADAVRRAKSEKEAQVVWIRLRANTLSGETRPNDNPYNVYIEYSVFAPTTAKQVASGNAFPGAYRNGGVIVSPGTSGMTGDYALNQAAKDVADKILNHFHIGKFGT
jgi:hypothetical protein